MPVREIRRESFRHEGRSYDVIVSDDGKRLTVLAQREGKPLRGGRSPFPPYGWQGYTSDQVDGMIDDAKQWIIDRAVHAWTPTPLARPA